MTATANEVRSQLPPGTTVPAESDELFLLYALLVKVKGLAVTREDVHDAWAVWLSQKRAQHYALVPYAELPQAVRFEDEPFLLAIHEVARRRKP